jgi:hypothetical protein
LFPELILVRTKWMCGFRYRISDSFASVANVVAIFTIGMSILSSSDFLGMSRSSSSFSESDIPAQAQPCFAISISRRFSVIVETLIHVNPASETMSTGDPRRRKTCMHFCCFAVLQSASQYVKFDAVTSWCMRPGGKSVSLI